MEIFFLISGVWQLGYLNGLQTEANGWMNTFRKSIEAT